MIDLDNIQPFHSAGGVVLGWPEENVVEVLGNKFVREVDGDGDVCIEYETLGIRCTFWESDGLRLGVVGVERPTALLHGHQLFGHSKAELKQFISSFLKSDITEEGGVEHDDGEIQEWIDVDNHGLAFWFRDNSLYLIDVFCAWSDPDTPNWPSE